MAYDGINWQVLPLPFGAGLQQGTDIRARPQPFLDIAHDVEFNELGGLQTRPPYTGSDGVSPLPDSSVIDGASLTNVRRIVANGDELVLFTHDTLYSRNVQLKKWVPRGPHLAVTVDEQPTFTTTGDQIDSDRAELAGTVVFAWTEGTQVFAAALDKTTGSVLVAPTAVSAAAARPRLVALDTKILLFTDVGSSTLTVRAIDPAAPGTAIAGAGTTVLAGGNFNACYDVVKAGTQDLCVGACRRTTTTSYTVFKVTPALAVTTVTKVRTADGPLAVATVTDGTTIQLVRSVSAGVRGDLLTTTTLADVFTDEGIGTATGTPVNQIAVAYTGTTAHVFWSSNESIGGTVDFGAQTNTVDTTGTVGTPRDFVQQLGVASRAFTYDGHVYVWLAFGCESKAVIVAGTGRALGIRAQLQNSYFLYRDDGLLVSRAAFDVGGGFSSSTGHLPGVHLTGGATEFAWCGTSRRIIRLGGAGNTTGFDARSPREIVFTFDSNAARRCVRLGRTLYISGGLMMQYDGCDLVEFGFQVYPFVLAGTALSGASGALPAGEFDYQATLRRTNGQGEQERSTTAIGIGITTASGDKVQIATVPLHVTRRTAGNVPAIEFWRTEVNPPDGAPSFLVTSKDPQQLSGDNWYIANDSTVNLAPALVLTDNFTDDILGEKQANPENGAVLENLAPPGARIIKATDTRLWLWGIPGDLDRVWYSKQRNTGEIAAFHDSLTIRIPAPGGRATSMWFQDQVLYVGRETAIYAVPGQGLDNLGQGTNFADAREVSLDVGVVNDESVALTPLGTVFKSRKGWYLHTGATQLQYIGGPVSDYDAEEVLAVNVVETLHQVRILTTGRMLLWDYHAATAIGQWGEWTVNDGVHATVYAGRHVYLANDGSAQGIKTQQDGFAGVSYGMDAETAWIKPSVLAADAANDRVPGGQGAARVRKVQPFGEIRSACQLRVRIAYDYEMNGGAPVYTDDQVWPVSPLVIGGPLQVEVGTTRPQCEAIKVRLTAVSLFANQALFSTADLSAPVLTTTPGQPWAAAFLTLLPEESGEAGNRVTMSIAFDQAGADVPFSIDVRDDFTWDPTIQNWSPQVGNVGVRVACSIESSPTVSDLELVILTQASGHNGVVGDRLDIDFFDPNPGHVIDAESMIGNTVTGKFAGGAYSAPEGEAIKLTALGLEVGVEPGLYRRLPAAQKI